MKKAEQRKGKRRTREENRKHKKTERQKGEKREETRGGRKEEKEKEGSPLEMHQRWNEVEEACSIDH